MEKIKKILSPGKPVDDEILYGAGRSSNSPLSGRSSKDHGSDTASQASPAGKAREAASGDQSSASQVGAQDYASQEPQQQLKADTLSSQETNYETTGALRPDLPTPTSAASNASIKSNVIGRVPTGSVLTQEDGTLPTVPATDGKFMNDDALDLSKGTNDGSFPLGETSTTGGATSSSGPHQTATANSLDPNVPSQAGAEATADSQTHHYGRDAAIAGAGVAGVGAYEASKHKGAGNDESTATTGLAVTSDTAEAPVISGSSATSQPQEDWRSRHMPGAYPETPQNEVERNLDVDTAGVGSGAAVAAAQKAFQKHTPAEQAPRKQVVDIEPEATPYTATNIDPRVDSTARQAAARSAAGGAIASQTTTSRDAEPTQQQKASELAFSEKEKEKEKEPEAKKDRHVDEFALAGATAAAGAGAYEVSKHRDHDVPSKSEGEAFPSLDEETLQQQEPSAPAIVTTDTSEERAFPLGHPQEQSRGTTNFSYPTGAKEASPKAQESEFTQEHRQFPDAAETGAAGAGGVAAYEALKHDQDGHDAHVADDPLATTAHPKALEGYDDQRAVPSHAAHPVDYEPDAAYGHHDAAMVGGSTAAATLATSKPLDSKLEKEREKTAERRHEEHEKQDKHTRKSEEKHRRSTSKSEDKEHKHGLLHRILHRHKSKEGLEDETEGRTSAEKSPVSPERSTFDEVENKSPVAGSPKSSVAYSPSSASEHGRHSHDRNKLHKEPPPGYQSKRSVENA